MNRRRKIALVVGILLAAFVVWGIFLVPPVVQSELAAIGLGGLSPIAVLYGRLMNGLDAWPWYYGFGYGLIGAAFGGMIEAVLTLPGPAVDAVIRGVGMGLGFGIGTTAPSVALITFAHGGGNP